MENNQSSFLIQDVFSIMGRGIVATGEVKGGTVKPGMTCRIEDKTMTVQSIEKFRKIITEAGMGENVGLLLENADSELLKRYVNQTVTFSGGADAQDSDTMPPEAATQDSADITPPENTQMPPQSGQASASEEPKPEPIEPKGFLSSLLDIFKKK